MKEVLFKGQYTKYENIKHREHNPINFISNTDDVVGNCFGINEVHVSKPTPRHPLFMHELTDNTEEIFSENFSNPMWSVQKSYFMVVVEKDGDKVVIKTFNGFKYRRAGVQWFKISKNMEFISVNTKTGDVYVGGIDNYHLKRKCRKRIRRNYFIGEPINTMMSNIKNNLRGDENTTAAIDSVSVFMNEIDRSDNFGDLTFSQRLFKFYLDKRGIKYPNNFGTYKQHLIGPSIRKKLKKNGSRLVDAFMDEKNLSGALLKKSLHECERINLDVYCYAKKVFGIDKLNQDKGTVLGLLESINHVNSPQNADSLIELISPSELDRYYQTFKEVFIYGNIDTYTLSDHVRMYCELRGFGVDVKWMADGSNKEGFHQEHLDWTDKLTHYRDGSYTRIYPDVLHQLLSKDINGVKPVLLTTSKEYNEESSTQSNCVKSYVSRPASIIISLRNEEKERATIEYQVRKINDEVIIQRVQSLGKRNTGLKSEWDDILLSLDKIMLYYIQDKNFDFVKVIKENKMGMRFESNSVWGDYNSLVWEDKRINQGFIGLFY